MSGWISEQRSVLTTLGEVNDHGDLGQIGLLES